MDEYPEYDFSNRREECDRRKDRKHGDGRLGGHTQRGEGDLEVLDLLQQPVDPSTICMLNGVNLHWLRARWNAAGFNRTGALQEPPHCYIQPIGFRLRGWVWCALSNLSLIKITSCSGPTGLDLSVVGCIWTQRSFTWILFSSTTLGRKIRTLLVFLFL